MATSSNNVSVRYLDLSGSGSSSATPRLLQVTRRPASERLAHALTASLPHAAPVLVASTATPSSSNG